MERAVHVIVPCGDEWCDIGNEQTLMEQLGKQVIGRGQINFLHENDN